MLRCVFEFLLHSPNDFFYFNPLWEKMFALPMHQVQYALALGIVLKNSFKLSSPNNLIFWDSCSETFVCTCRKWKNDGECNRSTNFKYSWQVMVSFPSTWGYCLCLSIHCHPPWDRGTFQFQMGKIKTQVKAETMYWTSFFLSEGHFGVSSTREQDHEKGLNDCYLDYNILLPLLCLLRICSFWKSNTRKPLDRVWLLWALLAHWLC